MEKTLGTSEIPRLRAPQSGVHYRYFTSKSTDPSKAKSVLASEAICEIVWESDRRFA
jgi:hypothetical protein